ncbi:unnamed protein product, partial [Prorocentrum cordatum]
MVQEAVHGLNWLAGYDTWDSGQESAAPGILTPEVLPRVEGLVKDWEPMPEALSGREALRDLLRGRSQCELETGSANLAASDADLVSLPDDVSGSPPIESLLDAEVSRYLEAYHELMLRPLTEREDIESETREITPCTDRKLLCNKKVYHAFVKKLWGLGMLGVWLCTSEAFASIEIGGGDLASLEALRLHLGMADAKDCFHRLKADERLAAAAPGPRGSELLRDRSPPLVLSEGRPRHCVCVDSLGAFARDQSVAGRAVWELGADFESHGLELHGGEVLSQ